MSINRKQAVRSVFTVKEKAFITPHYIRVVLHMSDEQVELFRNVKIGSNNKIFLPLPGTNQVIFPDEIDTDLNKTSVRRTYTTRHIDYLKKEIFIDFIAHGDNGPASHWANQAIAGSNIGMAMKVGNRPLFPNVEYYLLVADSTGIPVISAILEQLPANVEVHAIIEVFNKEDELLLNSKANLSVEWIYNTHPEHSSNLADIVRKRDFPIRNRFLFAATEYATAKDLKIYFRDEQYWQSGEYSITSYWKKGESEDKIII
jgi:NADPH-dependent ferric siderophore reductase